MRDKIFNNQLVDSKSSLYNSFFEASKTLLEQLMALYRILDELNTTIDNQLLTQLTKKQEKENTYDESQHARLIALSKLLMEQKQNLRTEMLALNQGSRFERQHSFFRKQNDILRKINDFGDKAIFQSFINENQKTTTAEEVYQSAMSQRNIALCKQLHYPDLKKVLALMAVALCVAGIVSLIVIESQTLSLALWFTSVSVSTLLGAAALFGETFIQHNLCQDRLVLESNTTLIPKEETAPCLHNP